MKSYMRCIQIDHIARQLEFNMLFLTRFRLANLKKNFMENEYTKHLLIKRKVLKSAVYSQSTITCFGVPCRIKSKLKLDPDMHTDA